MIRSCDRPLGGARQGLTGNNTRAQLSYGGIDPLPVVRGSPLPRLTTVMRRYPSHVYLALRLCVLCLLPGLPSQASAQPSREAAPPERLAIFLDCPFCDEDFIRQEMRYVDYVRDREVADVHVLVTRQPTGAGGQAFTLDLISLAFEGMDYSTVYTTSVDATDDEERTGFLRTLEAALVPYLLQTSIGPRVRVDVAEPSEEAAQARQVDDRWNSWTFEVYADGFAEFESRQRSFDTRYGVFVDRVTEDWKIQLRPFFNYEHQRFEREDGTITSTSRRDGVTSYAVRSISPHWSVGAFGDVFTSTFANVKLRYRFMPAVEYSLFPYREATRRQLRINYRIGASQVAYLDTTIYGEIEQLLPEHILNAGYEVRQPWGGIDFAMRASQYLHDRDKYSVEFGGGFEVRVLQGLSVGLGGAIELIHNQVNLPKGDAGLEEVLLRQRQLATSYEAGVRFRLRYRFGSIYNNVVNPRLTGGRNQDHF